jgi:hypothetical protein
MRTVEFEAVPFCSHIQGFSFCSGPYRSVSFHRIAVILAAAATPGAATGRDLRLVNLRLDLSSTCYP